LKKAAFLPLLLLAAVAAAAPAAPAPAAGIPVVMKERPIRLPPLFWFERDREQDSRLVMAAMLYWDAREGDSSQRLLLPIFYRWREGDRSFLISLPLILSYAAPDDRWLLAGPLYRRTDEEKTQTLFFPLYWQRVRHEGGRVTSALPFLLYDYRSRDRSKVDTLFPGGFFRRRGDMNTGLVGPYFWETDPESRFRVLFPVYWHGRSPKARFDVVPPFYSHWAADAVFLSTATAGPGRRRVGLFPLVGAGWGEDFRSHHLFPLYYASRDGDGRRFLTLPYSSFRKADGRAGHAGLYFYNRDPDLRVDGVFPFWMRRRSTDGFESKTQVLNFYHSRENDETFHTLFPLYGAWSNPEESRLLSWGAWRRRTPEGVSGWSLLYLWKHAENGDENRIFLPLYWHFKRAPDWQVDVLFPLYTRYRDGDTVVTAVPPVIWRKSPGRRSISLFFLYWHDDDGKRRLTTLAPFFLAQGNPDRKSFFSPLVWTRRSKASREGIVPPVYWYRSAEARRTFIVPLYWDVRTANRELWILPPAYRWRRDATVEKGFFPLWGRRTERVEEGGVVRREARGGYLFPFYWADTDGKGNGTWIIPPILGFVNRAGAGTPEARFSMQYLLFGSVRKKGDELEHGFFPLYQYIRRKDFVNWWAPRGLALAAYERRGTDAKGVALTWLWWRSLGADRDLVLPLFYRSRVYEVEGSTPAARGVRTGGATVFFPLWWSGTDKERSYLYVPPLYARDRGPERSWRLVMPLWVSYDSVSGRKFRTLFPLYWRTVSHPAPPEEPGTKPPVEKREVMVWGPAYRVDTWRAGQRTRTVGLAPLFSRTFTSPEDKYWEVLGGLFGRDVQSGRRRFRILWLFYTPASR
jgi:hypothetical protein